MLAPVHSPLLRPPGLLLRPPSRSHLVLRRTTRRQASPKVSEIAATPSSSSSSSSSSSVLGAATLVAGTAVGAGILALPSATAQAGFAPSAVALTGGAIYSVATGLLIAEVALRAADRRRRRRRDGNDNYNSNNNNNDNDNSAAAAVSLQSMASASLGPAGASVASAAYLFLHYALLVAYVAKAGELLAQAPPLSSPEQAPLAGAAFALALGGLCFSAPPAQLDAANGAMFAATVASFAALCVLAATGAATGGEAGGDAASSSSFAHLFDAASDPAAWAALPPALPLVALAFVFHNVVPVVSASLGGDPRKIRASIGLGVALPWLMLLAWEAATLGAGGGGGAAVDAAAAAGGGATTTTIDPLARLAASSDRAAPLIAAFSLGAVATSFLGFTLGLTTFFDDAIPALRREKDIDARPPASAFFLALAPPVAVAAVNPGAFFGALDAAGTYGVLTLFGLLPPAMVWAERYGGVGEEVGEEEGDRGVDTSASPPEELLPGGKPALLFVGLLAGAVMANSAAADMAAALASSR